MQKSVLENSTCVYGFKKLKKVGIEKQFLNLIIGINKKSIVNFLLNDKKSNTFLLKLGARKEYLLLLLLFNIVLEVLDSAIKK